MKYLPALIVAIGLLSGCGEEPPPISGDKNVKAEEGIIPQHQLDALQKAKDVEAQMKEAAERY